MILGALTPGLYIRYLGLKGGASLRANPLSNERTHRMRAQSFFTAGTDFAAPDQWRPPDTGITTIRKARRTPLPARTTPFTSPRTTRAIASLSASGRASTRTYAHLQPGSLRVKAGQRGTNRTGGRTPRQQWQHNPPPPALRHRGPSGLLLQQPPLRHQLIHGSGNRRRGPGTGTIRIGKPYGARLAEPLVNQVINFGR